MPGAIPLMGLLVALVGAPGVRNLLANPGFEEGWTGWSANHAWYEAGGPGKGRGISAWALDEAVPHSGRRCLRVEGKGNRGIAIQDVRAFPDRYRVTGWVRTRDLRAGQAEILIEFMGADGRWIAGTPVGGVYGTTDWTFISGEVQAPAAARTIRVDLRTTDPNNGTAWFDDITLEDATHDTEPPGPVRAVPAPAEAGTITLRWDPSRAEPDVVAYELFVSPRPFRSIRGMLPCASTDRDGHELTAFGLKRGGRYYARVVAVDQDDNRLMEGPPTLVIARDTRPPRAIALSARPVLAREGAVLVRWRPHRLDADLARFVIRVGARTWTARRHERQALLERTGFGAVTIRAMAVDEAGNRGPEVALTVTVPPAPSGASPSLSGTVRAAGALVAGALVQATDGRGGRWQTRTDTTGVYALAVPHGRLLRLRAAAPGFHDSADTLALLRAGDRLAADLTLPLRMGDLAAWTVSPVTNVLPDAEPPREPVCALDWMAARGETEGAQVVLRGVRPFTIAGVEFEPLRRDTGPGIGNLGRARLPASCLRAAVVGTLLVNKNSTATPPELLLRKAPADLPDPFLEGDRHDVPAGVSRSVFVMVDVPRGAAPGLYRGEARVQVETEGGRRAQAVVPIRLDVARATLPAAPTIPVTHWFNAGNFATWHGVPMWSEPFWEILRAYARDMAEHRQTVAMVPLDTIQPFRNEKGQLAFDFSRFDRWVGVFDAAGVGQRIEVMHFGGREHGQWEDEKFVLFTYPCARRGGGPSLPVTAAEMAAAIQRHLAQKGWLRRAVVHIADEPIPINVASWREISRQIHAAAPALRRVDAIHVPPEEVRGDLEVLVPQLNYFDQWHERFLAAQKAGSELWFYIAWVPQGKYPNRLIDYPAIKTRIIPWMVYALGATGYLHWGYNFWTDRLADMGYAPGDNWIVYPGTDGPRSSLRWEAFRDGLEDCELFRMLHARDPVRARALMAEAVRSPTDYEVDAARLEAVRRKLLRALSS